MPNPVILTVGDLKKALAALDDKMRLDCSVEEHGSDAFTIMSVDVIQCIPMRSQDGVAGYKMDDGPGSIKLALLTVDRT